MSTLTPDPRRHARLLPRPRACDAADLRRVGRRHRADACATRALNSNSLGTQPRTPLPAHATVAHAPTLRSGAFRPVCWPLESLAVQGDTLRFFLVSRASNRRPRPSGRGDCEWCAARAAGRL